MTPGSEPTTELDTHPDPEASLRAHRPRAWRGELRPAELFQLDDSTCWALVGVHHVGRLIVPGDDPYVVPLNYRAVDGAIVVRTERRPVIEGVVDHAVVFEVDMFDERTRSGWSVVVRGQARIVTSEEQLESDVESDAVPHSWAPGQRNCVIRIEPERISGRLLRGAVVNDATDERGYL